MKRLITLEAIGELILGVFLFSRLDFTWWWFLALLLVPDFSMIGYLFNTKTGAWIYNFFHHKLLAIVLFIAGHYLVNQVVILSGVILFAHSAMDRVAGYGLKFEDSFKNTHLGKL
jgi:Domain of unknown function (DUF4260)